MAAIDPASWFWPETSDSMLTRLANTELPSEARAAYILGAMLPSLGGNAQSSALTYLSGNVPLLADLLGAGSPEYTQALGSITNAMGQPAREPPGFIQVQDQRQRALSQLGHWTNALFNQNPDKFAELSWLNTLAGLGNQQPKTRGQWAKWNSDMRAQIDAAPTMSPTGATNAWGNMANWFANPAYTAPTVVSSPGKNIAAGAMNWWS